MLGKEVTLCGEGMINGAGDIQMQIKCVKRTKLGLNLKPVEKKKPKQNNFCYKLQKIAQHMFRLQTVLAVQLINYSWLNHLQLYVKGSHTGIVNLFYHTGRGKETSTYVWII